MLVITIKKKKKDNAEVCHSFIVVVLCCRRENNKYSVVIIIQLELDSIPQVGLVSPGPVERSSSIVLCSCQIPVMFENVEC